MSLTETVAKLCEIVSIAQSVIKQQAELLMMHGIETDSGTLEELRDAIITGGCDDYPR